MRWQCRWQSVRPQAMRWQFRWQSVRPQNLAFQRWSKLVIVTVEAWQINDRHPSAFQWEILLQSRVAQFYICQSVCQGEWDYIHVQQRSKVSQVMQKCSVDLQFSITEVFKEGVVPHLNCIPKCSHFAEKDRQRTSMCSKSGLVRSFLPVDAPLSAGTWLWTWASKQSELIATSFNVVILNFWDAVKSHKKEKKHLCFVFFHSKDGSVTCFGFKMHEW